MTPWLPSSSRLSCSSGCCREAWVDCSALGSGSQAAQHLVSKINRDQRVPRGGCLCCRHCIGGRFRVRYGPGAAGCGASRVSGCACISRCPCGPAGRSRDARSPPAPLCRSILVYTREGRDSPPHAINGQVNDHVAVRRDGAPEPSRPEGLGGCQDRSGTMADGHKLQRCEKSRRQGQRQCIYARCRSRAAHSWSTVPGSLDTASSAHCQRDTAHRLRLRAHPELGHLLVPSARHMTTKGPGHAPVAEHPPCLAIPPAAHPEQSTSRCSGRQADLHARGRSARGPARGCGGAASICSGRGRGRGRTE